jgi:aspartate 1-decarboxylase
VQRVMLRSKLHGVTVTGTELDYEGSITLDRALLEAADMLPGEQVHVLNLNTGSRIMTYIIEAASGSGTVLLNGPAARTGEIGDELIVLSYCQLPEAEARDLKAKVVFADERNRPSQKGRGL